MTFTVADILSLKNLEPVKPIRCMVETCQTTFSSIEEFGEHLKEKHQCMECFCGRIFLSTSAMYRHQKLNVCTDSMGRMLPDLSPSERLLRAPTKPKSNYRVDGPMRHITRRTLKNKDAAIRHISVEPTATVASTIDHEDKHVHRIGTKRRISDIVSEEECSGLDDLQPIKREKKDTVEVGGRCTELNWDFKEEVDRSAFSMGGDIQLIAMLWRNFEESFYKDRLREAEETRSVSSRRSSGFSIDELLDQKLEDENGEETKSVLSRKSSDFSIEELLKNNEEPTDSEEDVDILAI